MAKKQQPEHVKLPQPIQGDGDNAMPKTDKASNPEKTFYYDVSQDKEEEKKLLNPSRWYMASTAFPMIAGTMGPMANAFNICALGQYWRETFTASQTIDGGDFFQDPPWLLAVNAVSLVCALVANASLLLNMAGRLRFGIAQPITISGFFTAAILLIALVAKASTESFHPHGVPGNALSQAFYYACFAAGIYLFVAILMTITVIGALTGKYEKRFDLTTAQRTLMLQSIVLLGYLMLGALIFSHIEGWKYLDALYWANFTLLTIGLGEPFVPVTHTGRSLLIPYAVGGIVTLGLTISSIRTMAVENGKEKIFARVAEKDREAFARRAHRRVSKNPDAWSSISTKHRRKLEFHAMREIQRKSLRRSQWRALFVSVTAAFSLWFFGALVFMYTEYEQGWSYFEALYFSYVVLLSIGYGDLSPSSNSGKAFFVFWTLLAVPSLTMLISDMSDTVVKLICDVTNWAGSLTILPGETSGWRKLIADLKRRDFWTQFTDRDPHSVFLDAEKQHTEKVFVSQDEMRDDKRLGDLEDILRSRLTSEELKFCRNLLDKDEHDDATKDAHFYRWLLSREVATLMEDTTLDEPKKYTYDEWSYFLALLGHDEGSAQGPKLKQLIHPEHSKSQVRLGRIFDSDGQIHPWSWLGLRSPLMSAKNEAQWLLYHLIGRLQTELHTHSLYEEQQTPPPVRLTELHKRAPPRSATI